MERDLFPEETKMDGNMIQILCAHPFNGDQKNLGM